MSNVGLNDIYRDKNRYVLSGGLFLLAQIIFTLNYFKFPSFGFIGLIKALLVPAILIFSVVMISNRGFLKSIEWNNLKPILSYKIMALFFFVLLFVYSGLNYLKVQIHIPLMMLIVVLSASYLLMLFFEFSGRLDRAVYVFFLCFPLLNLAENWLGITRWSSEGGLIITPTAFFVLSLFIGVFAGFSKRNIVLTRIHIAIFVCLAIFLISGLISSILSIAPWESFNAYLYQYFYPILILPVVFLSIDSDVKRGIFVNLLIATFVLHVLISFYIFQRYGAGFLNMRSLYSMGLASGFTSGLLATLILFISPLVLFMIFIKDKLQGKLLYMILFLFLFLLMVITLSRSSLVAFFIGLSVMLFFNKTRKYLLPLILIMIILGAIFYPILSASRYMTIFAVFKDVSSRVYFNAWSGALDMIRDYPFFGIGSGLWDRYVAQYVPTQRINLLIKKGVWAKGYIVGPHSFYLKMYLEAGITGLISWILFVVLCFTFAIKMIRESCLQMRPRYFLGIAYLIFLATIAIKHFSGGGFVLGFYLYGLIFWAINGLFLGSISLKNKDYLQ